MHLTVKCMFIFMHIVSLRMEQALLDRCAFLLSVMVYQLTPIQNFHDDAYIEMEVMAEQYMIASMV